jgi:phage shock protein A
MDLKADAKRLQNRVNDVTKSREAWRGETRQLSQRIQELEAENAALQAAGGASKKNGRNAATRLDRGDLDGGIAGTGFVR